MSNDKKKILIIDAHPYEKSFCAALAQKYYEGSKEGGFEVEFVKLRELTFDPILHGGYSVVTELEQDLKHQQELIKWCEHLVLVTPLWWANVPALLKGYFDRVWLPGFAFKYSDDSPVPAKLLEGRSATVFYTQGSPFLFSLLVVKDAFWNSLKSGVVEFCGFKPVKRVVFDFMSQASEKKRAKWLEETFKKGKKGY